MYLQGVKGPRAPCKGRTSFGAAVTQQLRRRQAAACHKQWDVANLTSPPPVVKNKAWIQPQGPLQGSRLHEWIP